MAGGYGRILARYRANVPHVLTGAMHAAATRDPGGVHVYEGESLFALAREAQKPILAP